MPRALLQCYSGFTENRAAPIEASGRPKLARVIVGLESWNALRQRGPGVVRPDVKMRVRPERRGIVKRADAHEVHPPSRSAAIVFSNKIILHQTRGCHTISAKMATTAANAGQPRQNQSTNRRPYWSGSFFVVIAASRARLRMWIWMNTTGSQHSSTNR